MPDFACFGLLDDAALVVAFTLLVLAFGYALKDFSFEVELDPPHRDAAKGEPDGD